MLGLVFVLVYQAGGTAEIVRVHKMLEEEAQHKKKLEEEIVVLRSQLLQLNFEAEQVSNLQKFE